MSTPITGETAWPELQRTRRAIVVVDVVESVRLMQAHEADVIDRWRRFVAEVRTEVLPKHGGRLVKSLGDGMLLEFAHAPPAVAAALEMQDRIVAYNAGRDAAEMLLLRMGVHLADVVVDELDVYGRGVNLAARLATLAEPGRLVVSAPVRDQLLDGVDLRLQDLGECYLKHLARPERAFQVDPARATTKPAASMHDRSGIGTTVAVVPLSSTGHRGQASVVGEFIADGVIAHLSRNPGLRVISRLSTSVIKGHARMAELARDKLRADYLLCGTCLQRGPLLLVSLELSDTRDQTVAWADQLRLRMDDLLSANANPVADIAAAVHRSIVDTEVSRVRTRPYPNLESFSLLVGSISLLHRSTQADFRRAGDVLDVLIERVPAHPSPHAWKAKWHFLNLIRGLSSAPDEERRRAQQAADRAVQCDESNALALTFKGLICGFLDRRLDESDSLYAQALALNPNEALAWLFTGTLRSWQGRGSEAAAAAEKALALSPLDPMRYYYDSLAAAAILADAQHGKAIELCHRSLRANRLHTATYRVLAIAQVMAGDTQGARQTAQDLMLLEPQLTVAAYSARYPGRDAAHAAQYAAALEAAGIPRQ